MAAASKNQSLSTEVPHGGNFSVQRDDLRRKKNLRFRYHNNRENTQAYAMH